MWSMSDSISKGLRTTRHDAPHNATVQQQNANIPIGSSTLSAVGELQTTAKDVFTELIAQWGVLKGS